MNVNYKNSLVMKERLLKYKTVNGLFKILLNLCNLLMTDEHYDNCYCNLTFKQCWLCNLGEYVRHNKIKDDLLRNRQKLDQLVDIAYRFLFYIKRIKNDRLNYEDREMVLEFFKRKFNCS